MPLRKIVFKPGINRDQTNYANEGGWWAGNKVRFLSGFPQKIGGWVRYTVSAYVGICRALFNWVTTTGYNLMAIGTNTKIYVESGANLYDITPIRATFTTTATDNCIATTINTKTITVSLTSHGGTTGDYVSIFGVAGSGTPPAIGGVPVSEINGEHVITVLNANTFTFTVSTTATSDTSGQGGTAITITFQISPNTASTVSGYGWGIPAWGGPPAWGLGAASPVDSRIRLIYFDKVNEDLTFNIRFGDLYYWEFGFAKLVSPATDNCVDTTTSSYLVNINITSHGLTTGDYVTFSGITGTGTPQTIGGVPITQLNTTHVITKVDANNFTITVTTAATSSVSNAGGTAITAVTQNAISESFKNIITASYSAYVNAGDVPEGVTYSMFDDTSGVMMAFGCTPYGGGTVNPLLVRWSSAYNPQNATVPYYLRWAPSIDPGESTAGYLSIQSGSQILYAVSNYGEVLVFTESSLTSLQAAPYPAGFTQFLKSQDMTLIGPRCVIARNNIVYWMGIDRFYYYDGTVRVIPCTLRQQVFDNINFEQSDQFFVAPNDKYNEVWWFYCSSGSVVIDSYVVYNYDERIWYYGDCTDGMVRTAWIDTGYRVPPVAGGTLVENGAYSTTDSSRNYLYNHETGNDDNNGASGTAPITSYIQSSDVDMDPDGDKFTLLRRIVPDVSFAETTAGYNPTAIFSVAPRNFPGAAYMTQNQESQTFDRSVSAQSVTIDQYTNQVFLRARARQMGFKIASVDLGVAWQLGEPRVDVRPDGTRG